ncbi:hypothetical protein M758_5G124000 [Ceratodon purpureus]|nr:hypothetical protein M758_5G124000 [Ceratodon purpureus]
MLYYHVEEGIEDLDDCTVHYLYVMSSGPSSLMRLFFFLVLFVKLLVLFMWEILGFSHWRIPEALLLCFMSSAYMIVVFTSADSNFHHVIIAVFDIPKNSKFRH